MPTSEHHARSRTWLIGVPKAMATIPWKIAYRSEALKSTHVPPHIRSGGMHCPACGKGQPFSRRCTFCGCDFACFIIMESPLSQKRKKSPGSRNNHRKKRSFAFSGNVTSRLSALPLRYRVLAVAGALIAALLVAFALVQYQRSVRKQYTQNFILALYGIKSGISLTTLVCEGDYNAWKGGDSAVSSTGNQTDLQAIADLQTVKIEVDGLVAKIGTAPAEYALSRQILSTMYANYGEISTKLIASTEALSNCKPEAAATNEKFMRDIESLKAKMPASLTKEFKKAGLKYDLRFMGF
ncbi:MAG TPA: hypothetical protein HPP94_03655 [Desulfuromonadales bacterium]|nr:hypothetical protein [Desulfuromonadales bacterium]